MVAAALLIGSAAARPTPAGIRASDKVGEDAVAASWNEARLRKLHVVRPDLISYPLMFEVIC